MKILRPILVIALLAGILPCSHADIHHDDHGHESMAELCAAAAGPCECHSCDVKPCTDQVEFQFNSAQGALVVMAPLNSTVLFTLSESRLANRKANPSVCGILASLQTIILLI